MYHDVVAAGAEDTSGFPGRDAALYKVTPERFGSHLAAIAADTVLTFDDGGAGALAAADLLEAHGFRGHFFITTNYIGTPGFLDARGVRHLHGRGHIVGSHSCSHPLRMGHCSRRQLAEEWTTSRAVLADIIGSAVDTASLPGGDFAPAVAEAAAEAGFTQLFTSEPAWADRAGHGLMLRGRFTIQRWTTARTAAALAAGHTLACARQTLVWNAKKIGKRVAGERYLQLRRALLRHGDDVRWGDNAA
jgi:peptidoglycan/xylan/chitin deacetylase (PgdA/CDA1 family)